MNPRLKQRKTRTTSGWLTRDSDGEVALWESYVDRNILHYHRALGVNSRWWTCGWSDARLKEWAEDHFKEQYAGIPRKGRAVWVEIELVVD